MSPRAAWRLDSLGFGEVYDYAGGKIDWFAAGFDREGSSAAQPTAGDLLHDEVPTCRLQDEVANVAAAVGDWDVCVVVNEERVVLGLLGRDALSGLHGDRRAGDVMRSGPSTYRPSVSAEELVGTLTEAGVERALITTSEGVLLGLVLTGELRRAADGSGQT